MSSWMNVNESYRERLTRAGLVSFDDWMQVARERERPAGRQETFTVFTLDVDDGFRVYLKRFRPSRPSAWFIVRRSRQRREAESAQILARLGVPTAEVVAAGEQRTCGCVSEAFVATKEITDARPLPEVLQTLETRADRLALVGNLAAIVRRMHDGDYVDHDLYFRNVLVRGAAAGRCELYIIDSPRGGRPWCCLRRKKLRDLATLNRDARGVVSRTDRVRFIMTYLGKDRLDRGDRDLCRRIDTRKPWADRGKTL